MSYCVKHTMLQTEATCRECGNEYCNECLVYPFGKDRPPMCIRCALAFSGVGTRRAARRVRPSWAERRRRAAAPKLPEVAPRPAETGPIELPEWATR